MTKAARRALPRSYTRTLAYLMAEKIVPGMRAYVI